MDTSGRTMDSVPPGRHPRPALAHGVAHRLPGGRGADSLPPRLSPHRRPQPDPCERPRAGRHAPDRAQEPRHLRPLQHHPRAGTARRRGPTRVEYLAQQAQAAGAGHRLPVRRGSRTGQTGTNRPAIVAHVATGRADAAEHRHVPGTASGIALNSGATRDHRLSRHPWLAPL